MRRLLVVVLLIAVSCGGAGADISAIPELPPITEEDLTARLAGTSRPVVVNVWASWCIPCRSEAPLLARAAEQFDSQVDFIGLNVRDSQTGAREFIAEFWGTDVPIEHLFDDGGFIPIGLGGSRGVPLTFFYATGGDLVTLHSGVIDERTLALQIDEILGAP